MAREVLSNGVIVPEKYTRDWFDDFRTNLVKLNDAITAIAGKQNALTQEQLDAVNSAITSQKVTAYDDHIADTSKHLTDGTASKAIADEDGTSIKTGYVNVAGNQTVSGDKSFTGSNTFNNILPNATNTYTLGSSSYQWSSVYAQTYYYNGTEFQSKFLTTDTDQTITGIKTWGNQTGNTAFSLSSKEDSSYIQINGGSGWQKGGAIVVSGKDRSIYTNSIVFAVNNSDNSGVEWVTIQGTSSGTQLKPSTNGTQDLGTSTNKWKALNGINPGALSLPTRDYYSYMDIDTTSWNITGTYFNYTPTIDAWMMINVSPSNNIAYVSAEYGTMRFNSESTTGRNAMITIPVLANKQVSIVIVGASIVQARLLPCQGNV